METKEFAFKGLTINGFLMLCINLILTFGGITLIVLSIINENLLFIPGGIILILSLFLWGGQIMLEPNETLVMVFFGKYKGTFTRTGFFWVNPFLATKKLSLHHLMNV